MPEVQNVEFLQRETARRRRRHVIDVLSRELNMRDPQSAASRFAVLLDNPDPRDMVVSADIDGLVSAAMLSHITGWKASVLLVKTAVYVSPEVMEGGLHLTHAFGVDVFSSTFPNVSNHPTFWGGKKPGNSPIAASMAAAHDQVIKQRSDGNLFLNPNHWAGIEGSYPGEANRTTSATYRYPLGAAQVLLALLEVVDRSPRLFDREYLPWLVANCDGGLESFRRYAYNVPMWWSCLAAAVGPASLSEQLYRLAADQRPTQFLDVVNQLRSEGGGTVARHLDRNWNLVSQGLDHFPSVVAWLSDISGWPDPIQGGVESLKDWTRLEPPRGKVLVSGLPVADDLIKRLDLFRWNLAQSLDALHTNFAFFDQSQALNWVSAPDETPLQEMEPLPTILSESYVDSAGTTLWEGH